MGVEEDYILAKDTSLKICDCDSVYFEFFTVAIYAILRKFGDYRELVLRIIEDSDIFIDDLTISEIMKKHNILNWYNFEKAYVNTTHAISVPGVTLSLENNTFEVEYSSPTVICSENCGNITNLLNCFIHEILHLLKSYFKCVEIKREDTDLSVAALRCGIYISRNSLKDGFKDAISEDYFQILDEAINVIQTTETMEEILSLKEICSDEDVLEFIDSLDEYKIHKDYGYSSIVPIVRTLWNNRQFRELVERNIVDGDIKIIFDEFNEDMGENMFQEVAQLVDDIYYAGQENKTKKVQRLKRELRSIIKSYNTKNNVLQKTSRQK